RTGDSTRLRVRFQLIPPRPTTLASSPSRHNPQPTTRNPQPSTRRHSVRHRSLTYDKCRSIVPGHERIAHEPPGSHRSRARRSARAARRRRREETMSTIDFLARSPLWSLIGWTVLLSLPLGIVAAAVALLAGGAAPRLAPRWQHRLVVMLYAVSLIGALVV